MGIPSLRSARFLFLCLGLSLLAACPGGESDDPPDLTLTGVDTTAPAAIADLAVVAAGGGTFTLTWTAVADDGSAVASGPAYDYVVVYSTAAITAANFDAATVFAQTWAPQAPGQAESHDVTGLTTTDNYWFAVKARDEVPNAAAISNVVSVLQDTVAPGAVADLAAATGSQWGTVVLTWTAPGNDDATGTASSYTVKYSTSTLDDTSFDTDPTFAMVTVPRTAGSAESITVYGLDPGKTYNFALKAIDENGNAGAISNVPSAQAFGLGDVVQAEAGYRFSAVLLSDGTVWCWGENWYGQCGVGLRVQNVTEPMQVKNITNAVEIGCGHYHVVARLNDGSVWAWGRNQYGRIGDNTTQDRFEPVQVLDAAGTGTLANITALAVGGGHSLALDSNGDVWAWGYNLNGELGVGTIDSSPHSLPEQITTLSGISRIWAGAYYSFAESGTTILGWGRNDYGQLGFVNTADQPTPVTSAFAGVTDLAPGYNTTIALESDGTLLACGSNQYGTLGQEHFTVAINSTPLSVLDGTGSDFSGVSSIWCGAANPYHIFAIKSDGTVWAWGYDAYGQHGDGTTTNKSYPQQVTNLANVSAVSCGSRHSIAVLTDGTVQSFGFGGYGQLGRPSYDVGTTPGLVTNLKAQAVAAGEAHTALLTGSGQVWTLGQNVFGQLGDGSFVNRDKPVQAQSIDNAAKIAAGSHHTVALLNDGTLMAFGRNGSGQLGDSTNTHRTIPVAVSSLTGVVAVAAGAEHTAALLSDGTVYTWGANDEGQLGDGTYAGRNAPAAVPSLTGVVGVACGRAHTLVLKNDGTVWGFGRNSSGQLGDSTTTLSTTAVQAGTLATVATVYAGGDHSGVILSDGTAWTWGANSWGQLGHGTYANATTPAQVADITGVAHLALGQEHTIALLSDGTGWSFGRNNEGGLGIGNTESRNAPWPIPGLTTGLHAACGFHSVLVDDTGDVFVAGPNDYGQCGLGSTYYPNHFRQLGGFDSVQTVEGAGEYTLARRANGSFWGMGYDGYGHMASGYFPAMSSPALLRNLTPLASITDVATDPWTVTAIDTTGQLWAWGRNTYGQAGNGSTQYQLTARKVPGMTDVVQAEVGQEHAMALKSDGTVWCWGRNHLGQCGNGAVGANVYVPTRVEGLADVTQVSAGYYTSYALKSDGTVWAWGQGDQGNIGDGAYSHRRRPVQVLGLAGVSELSQAYSHVLALKTDGTVWAWGYNDNGRLGDGSTVNRCIPVQVRDSTGTGYLTNVQAVASGYHSVAWCADGTVWAWGYNGYGELGVGDTVNPNPLPRQVTWTGGAQVTGIKAGLWHTALIMNDGSILMCGRNNYGQIGSTLASNPQTTPIAVDYVNAANVIDFEPAYEHTVVVMNDNTVWAWGRNDYGYMADGTRTNRTTAAVQCQKTGTFGFASEFAPGRLHSLLLQNDGTAWAFGYNGNCPLGDGTSTDRQYPVQCGTLTGVASVGASRYCGYAVLSSGQVWGWGYNGFWELSSANPDPTPSPAQIGAFTNAVSVTGGNYFTMILLADGSVYSLGYNNLSQCGFTAGGNIGTPQHVTSLSSVVKLVCGAYHGLALRSDGTVWSWGRNSDGDCGRGTATSPLLPGQISGLSNVVDIAASHYGGIACTADGSVYTWGRGSDGEIGNGGSSDALSPVLLTSLPPIAHVGNAFYYSNFAVERDGTLWAWGANWNGMLGLGHMSSPVTTPQRVERWLK